MHIADYAAESKHGLVYCHRLVSGVTCTSQADERLSESECCHSILQTVRRHMQSHADERLSGSARFRNEGHTLLRATTKGVLRILSRLMDSMVCCSRPCIMSTTRMAMSHKLDPRDLKLEKDS